ncbi:hypothetical protein H0H93_007500 [Arthromyces matolae]|nr:hypothetical protein H0H93_007500 [Arthromyces matolae]
MKRNTCKKRKSDASDINDATEDVVIKKDAHRRARGHKGKLSGLLDLPIDVLFEIFGNLNPFDLLKLARTTKEFRRLLMNKGSKSVWKAALDSVTGLPPSPPEMSEPAWVHLVFDPHCNARSSLYYGESYHLTRSLGLQPSYRPYRRMDAQIAHILNTKADSSPEFDPPMSNLKNFPLEELLLTQPTKRDPMIKKYLARELMELKKKYIALNNDKSRSAFIAERRKYVSDVQTHAKLCQGWAKSQVKDRSTELQQLKDMRLAAIIDKLTQLGYAEEIASIRYPDSLENHPLVKKPQKLTERIWANIKEEMLQFMDAMHTKRLEREHDDLVLQRKPSAVAVFRDYVADQHPFTDVMPSGLDFCSFGPVKVILEQPTEVTVDATSFADVATLIPDFIAQWRNTLDGRLFDIKNSVPGYHYSAWRDGPFFNRYGEFSSDDGSNDYSDDEESDESSVPNFVFARKDRPSPVKEIPDEESLRRLRLATTVFQCTRCVENGMYHDGFLDDDDFGSDDGATAHGADPWGRDVDYPTGRPLALFYPKVKGHICLTRKGMPRSFDGGGQEDSRPAIEPARILLPDREEVRRQWTTMPLRISPRLGECVKAIVEAASLDPDKTTAEDMDSFGHLFACFHCAYDCSDKSNPRAYEMPAFTWRVALEHYGASHLTQNAVWIFVDEQNITNAVDAFKSNPNSSHNNPDLIDTAIPTFQAIPPSDDATWCCVRCRDTPDEVSPTSISAITTHLGEKHQVQMPELNRDYYEDFSALPPLEHLKRILVTLSREDLEARKAQKAIPFLNISIKF